MNFILKYIVIVLHAKCDILYFRFIFCSNFGNVIQVDQAKIKVIAKFPPPISIKGARSFLGHAGFYQRFIKEFSKVAHPLSILLEKKVSSNLMKLVSMRFCI